MTSTQPAPKSHRHLTRQLVLPWVLLVMSVIGLAFALVTWRDPAIVRFDTLTLMAAVVLAHRLLVPLTTRERTAWTHALALGFVFAAFMTSGALASGAVALVSAVSAAGTTVWLQRNQDAPRRWAASWAFVTARSVFGVLLGMATVAVALDLHPSTPGETHPFSILLFAGAVLLTAIITEIMVLWRDQPEWFVTPSSRWADWSLGAITPSLAWDGFVVSLAVAVAVLIDALAVRIGVPIAVAIAFVSLAAISRLVDLNARLRERNHALARATGELRTINAIGQVLSATLDLDELCQELARQVQRVMPADVMMIGLYDEQSGEVRFPFYSYSGIRQPARVEHLPVMSEGNGAIEDDPSRATESSDVGTGDDPVQPVSGGIVPRVLTTRLPVLGDDTETFPLHRADGTPLPTFRSGVRRFRSVLGVPLLTGGRVIGVICVKRHRPNAYGLEHIALLTSIANQAAVAIHNARLFDEQRAAVQAKQDFLSVVSHELRTPITSVSGYSQLLRRRLQREASGEREGAAVARPVSSYLQIVNVIEDQSRQLGRLVDDLLQLSRLESGRLSFNFELMDLAVVAREAVESIQVSSELDRVKLDAPETAPMVGDPLRLRQVLDNLVENALKYAPEPAVIRVKIHAQPDEMVIQVVDTGPGIPNANLPHIFEPFYRVEREDGTTRRGLGLGLSICREIAVAHRGLIVVTSELGVGATFRVQLPTTLPVSAGPLAGESVRPNTFPAGWRNPDRLPPNDATTSIH